MTQIHYPALALSTFVLLAAHAPIVHASQVSPAPASQAQPPSDATLKDRIQYRVETSATLRTYDVKVAVDGGVATLSGTVATAAQKEDAGRVAKVDGITRVENTLEVDKAVDKSVGDRIKGGFTKTGEKISDGWITTKINWFFVGEDLLKGSDINVDTKDNVVTLKGTVGSKAGQAKAMNLAKDTDGVKRVVDQLVVRAAASQR